MRRGLIGFGALCAALWLAVWAWARMPLAPPLDAGERAQTLRVLRAALDGKDGGAAPSAPGPYVVTVFDAGRVAARVEGERLADATRALAAVRLDPEVRGRARIKVDRIVGRAPVLQRPAALLAISFVPGIDGVALEFGGRTARLLPDDLLAADALATYEPVGGLDLVLGTDVQSVTTRLAAAVGATAATWRTTPRRLYRFRVESFVEPAARTGPPRPVVRGHTAGPPPSREAYRAAAVAGGRYLLAQLDDEGRFAYAWHTGRDQAFGTGYSWARHAGTTYFLAQLHAATRDPDLADGVRRALAALQRTTRDDGPLGLVATDGNRVVELGSSALALLAAAEWERTTGDATFAPWSRRLAAFLVSMQRADGDFHHLYDTAARRPDPDARLLYYTGEAAFALAQLAHVPGLPPPERARYAEAAGRALTYLTTQQYGYFAGQFFFLEDHWTCLAAEAAWDLVPEPERLRNARFCEDFAAFLRRFQYQPGEAGTAVQPDLVGAYGFSPLLPPHPTPVGSRSEATLSVLAMAERRGAPARTLEALRRQLELGLKFLLDHQIDDDDAWLMPAPERARGGFHMSEVNRHVRIDFVQHACSALLRASFML